MQKKWLPNSQYFYFLRAIKAAYIMYCFDVFNNNNNNKKVSCKDWIISRSCRLLDAYLFMTGTNQQPPLYLFLLRDLFMLKKYMQRKTS